jgi:hypothetical protein
LALKKENSAMVSRVIRDAQEDGVIKPVDPESESRKSARYWPTWAQFYLTGRMPLIVCWKLNLA